MIRSRTMNTIHDLAAQGKSIQDIAITLGIARNKVRKYLRHPELVVMPHPRPNRRSKLDPFKEQVKKWIQEDHCYNCEAMLPRLLALGYSGSLSVLKTVQSVATTGPIKAAWFKDSEGNLLGVVQLV